MTIPPPPAPPGASAPAIAEDSSSGDAPTLREQGADPEPTADPPLLTLPAPIPRQRTPAEKTTPASRSRTLRTDARRAASAARAAATRLRPDPARWLGVPPGFRFYLRPLGRSAGQARRPGRPRRAASGPAPGAGPAGRLRRTPRPAAIATALTWAVIGVALFACYLHAASTSAVTSDGASNALQAWDLLHGDWLLRGWELSDVSFYTTELPQYALIELFTGLGPEVVPIASALTYTMLVLLAARLAQGQAIGRERVVRSLITGGVMLAPQLGTGVFVLVGSPDHTGSTVPVLLLLLVLDRAPRRWYVPAVAGLLLTWALIADGIVLFTGVLPLALVGLAGAYQTRVRLREPWRAAGFDLGLTLAALAAIWLSGIALRWISARGGFIVWPLSNQLLPAARLAHSAEQTFHGLLLLFGADLFGQTAGLTAALTGAHLVGLILAAWATCAALRRFAGAELAVRVSAVAILVTLAAYLLGTRAQDIYSTRDITALLPLGAMLAGRMLAGRLISARMLPALGVLLIAYLTGLGQVAAQPPAPPHASRLASWLAAHHLSYGLAGYWDANVTTLATGGKVQLLSVLADGDQITGDYWEVRDSWYDPSAHYANFVVLVPPPAGFGRYPTVASVRRTFGQPAQIYYLGQYTILVWDKNLLADLARGSWPVSVAPAPSPPALRIPGPPAQPVG